MLIQCKRHTKKDLELWKDYEEMDYINSKSEKLKIREEEALQSILNFSKNKNVYIGISWGKDSLTVADISYRNKIKIPLVHLYCVPSHNEYCDIVKKLFFKKYPKAIYYEIIVNYENIYSLNLPEHLQDTQTNKKWNEGFRTAEQKFGKCHISGIRKQESGIRKIRINKWGLQTKNTLCPIGYWTNEEVFAYLKKYNLPIHPNYALLGGGRYKREYIRVSEIGDVSGRVFNRLVWEKEYYQDILNRICS